MLWIIKKKNGGESQEFAIASLNGTVAHLNMPASSGKLQVSEAFINLIFGNSVLIFSVIIMQIDHDILWKGK